MSSVSAPVRDIGVKLGADKDYALEQFQDDFVFSEKKFPAFVAGWATGKSMSAIFKGLALSQESPKNLGLICRKEYTDLRDSTIQDFERYTGLKIKESTKEIDLPNGSKIMFRHAEELDTLKNINLGWFWIEQAEELDSAEQWFYLLGRLRREAKRRTGFITANTNGHNWIWEHWKEKPKTEDYHLIEATTFDNKRNLPEDFVESLKDIPDLIYKRFVLNDWNIAEGLVWPEFSPERHVRASYEIPKEWKEIVAVDHGYAHPTVALFGAVNYDGQLIIYDEYYQKEKLVSDHAKAIKAREPELQNMLRIIDPSCKARTQQRASGMFSIIDEYQDNGISFVPGQNDWDAGVNRVGELFKTGKITIFGDRCPNLVKELKNYKYKIPKPGAEKTDERPVKLHDDTCDALRYLVMARPPVPTKRSTKERAQDPALPKAWELIEPWDSIKDSAWISYKKRMGI